MSTRSYAVAAICAILAFTPAAAAQQHSKRRVAARNVPSTNLHGGAPPDTQREATRENNLGVALMTRREFDVALGKFQTACILGTPSDIACLNMGIALLNMHRYDDAARVLSKSVQLQPQNTRAWFNLALIQQATGRTDAALEDFQEAAALDPHDADTQCLTGRAYLQGQHYDQAVAAFETAARLDPFNVSAESGLADAMQKLEKFASATEHRERARYLAEHRLGRPIGSDYGALGKYSTAQMIVEAPGQAPPAIPVRFVDVTRVSGLLPRRTPPVAATARNKPESADASAALTSGSDAGKATPETLASYLGSGACVFDYDDDGRPDIFLPDAKGGGRAALYRNIGNGQFADATKAAKLEFPGEVLGCAVGDYDNDGHPDIAVGSAAGLLLFHNEGNGTFRDVTDEAGIRTPGLVLGMTFLDYDRDGDLDLYVTRSKDFPRERSSEPFDSPKDAGSPGNILWRNAAGDKFIDLTGALDLGGNSSSVGAVSADLNNDGAPDLVVTTLGTTPVVFMNLRDGPFVSVSPWSSDVPGAAASAVALDVDRDGWMDLAFTHWSAPGLSLWRNVGGKRFERATLRDPGWERGWGIAVLDYDNDGWPDLVAVGETSSGDGSIVLLRNEGIGEGGHVTFRDVTKESGLDKIALRDPRAVIAFDYDGDGGTDLLITQNHLPPVLLKNIGGNKNHWLRLAAVGDADSKNGIGTRVEIFQGAQMQVWEIPGAAGYLGQGPAELRVGLGGEEHADVVRLHWPSGNVQDEIDVPASKPVAISETMAGDLQH